MKPEVLKSWSLETDYSRASCLGADQKARGLWERDCQSSHTPTASFWSSLRLRVSLFLACAYATSVNIRYAYVYACAYVYVAV